MGWFVQRLAVGDRLDRRLLMVLEMLSQPDVDGRSAGG
jgi:hypothetical protein